MEQARKLVLISDSNRTFLMYLGILLKRMGMNVMNATTGTDALRLAREARPDMVILEVELPDINGIDVLRGLKSDAELSSIPVSMMSSSSDGDTVLMCREAGCTSFLSKPVAIPQLHDAIQDSVFAPDGIRRRHIRVNINRKVTVTNGSSSYEMYVEALSEGGIFLRRKDPLPVGTELQVELPVGGGRSIKLKGRVIYTRVIEAGSMNVSPGMALEFSNVPKQDMTTLKEFITLQIAEDIIDSQEEQVVRLGDYNPLKDVSRSSRTD